MMRILTVSVCALLSGGCACTDGGDDSSSEDADVPDDGGSDDAGSDGGSDVPDGACDDYVALKQALFGDLHVHTAYSLDAYATGNIEAGPAAAYAFGKKEGTITLASGETHEIDRKLDFLGVTDHAEYFAEAGMCLIEDFDSNVYDSAYCEELRVPGSTLFLWRASQITSENPEDPTICSAGASPADCEAFSLGVWDRVKEAAEDAYDKCSFTSFIAYEYSANPNEQNWHRNIIFENSNVVAEPIDYIDTPSIKEMLTTFDAACDPDAGCDAVLIPHSPNDSVGTKWDIEDAAEAELRAKWEHLVEITQHKGTSECLNIPYCPDPEDGCEKAEMSEKNDPDYESFCDFEISSVFGEGGEAFPADEPGYVRNGLAEGLEREADYGVNPLQLGFIGSTDTHNSTPGATKESAWQGHLFVLDVAPQKRLVTRTLNAEFGPVQTSVVAASPNWGPGGLAAVWAEENSRESIFAALQRRETFATSGTRMKVRFYQSYAKGDLCADKNFPSELVSGGAVPMGGSFTPEDGKTPRFVAKAFKDTDGADIDRVHLIEGALNGQNVVFKTYEAVADKADASTVCHVFTPEPYDASKNAWWYVRVLEEPTPRWSHYDCVVMEEYANDGLCGCMKGTVDSPEDRGDWYTDQLEWDAKENPDGYCACEQALYNCTVGGLDRDIQERAWTSPIWQVQSTATRKR